MGNERHLVQEAIVDTKSPVTANDRVQIDGVMSLTLHNAGDTTVTLNNHLTMKKGATLQLASPHPNIVFNTTLNIRFAPGEVGEVNRLEIMECRLASLPFTNFTRDDPADQSIRV